LRFGAVQFGEKSFQQGIASGSRMGRGCVRSNGVRLAKRSRQVFWNGRVRGSPKLGDANEKQTC
jgi:hypothetical protein